MKLNAYQAFAFELIIIAISYVYVLNFTSVGVIWVIGVITGFLCGMIIIIFILSISNPKDN